MNAAKGYLDTLKGHEKRKRELDKLKDTIQDKQRQQEQAKQDKGEGSDGDKSDNQQKPKS